jgi:hypothetical protein
LTFCSRHIEIGTLPRPSYQGYSHPRASGENPARSKWREHGSDQALQPDP